MKIAYIDHSYHAKTKSTLFFSDFLATFGATTMYWDDSWRGGPGVELSVLDEMDYDVIVVFQIMYPPGELKSLRCKTIFLIPMFDSVWAAQPDYWIAYRFCFFVSFSKTLHQQLERMGNLSFYLQYFPDPQAYPLHVNRDFRRVFFWERTRDIDQKMVQRWFEKSQDQRFQHHFCPDPGEPIVEVALPDSRWERSYWFDKKEDYAAAVEQCGIYVAPRKREGIGMSFLEAMASGMAVIGLPFPTLSDYVESGRNGLLVDEQTVLDATEIDWSSLASNARETVVTGFADYKIRLPVLQSWILEQIPNRAVSKRTTSYVAVYLRRMPSSVWRTVRKHLGPFFRAIVPRKG